MYESGVEPVSLRDQVNPQDQELLDRVVFHAMRNLDVLTPLERARLLEGVALISKKELSQNARACARFYRMACREQVELVKALKEAVSGGEV